MKIQVIFGSQSDERVYGPLIQQLASIAEVKMEVASAHRHPDRVRQIMSFSDADIFVAGAGLAAHLPGVVASMTQKPVFGVAVNGAFSGLDAFLSIAQMPKDIPVMAVMESQVSAIKNFIVRVPTWEKNILKLHWDLNLTESPLLTRVLQEIREKSGLSLEWIEATDLSCQGEIVNFDENPQGQGLCLMVCEKDRLQVPHTGLDFFTMAQNGGFWVGVNNTTNFVLQIKKLKESVR